MASPFVMVTPIACTPGTTGSFQDVDLDTFVADVTGATGVILRIINTANVDGYDFGARKNGSTDNRLNHMRNYTITTLMIGVDASNIFEIYIEHSAVTVEIVGYVKSGFTFNTNATAVTITTTGSWTEKDLSASAPSANILIFEACGSVTTYYAFGLRKKGSTDEHIAGITAHGAWPIVGCDAAQKIEYYNGHTDNTLYLVGYYVGTDFNAQTNGTDWSVAATGSYYDLPAAPDHATVAVVEIDSVTTTANGWIRKNGNTESLYTNYPKRHAWCITELDSNHLAEGRIGNTAMDFFLIAYDAPVPVSSDPEGSLLGGKLIRGGLLLHGVLRR